MSIVMERIQILLDGRHIQHDLDPFHDYRHQCIASDTSGLEEFRSLLVG